MSPSTEFQALLSLPCSVGMLQPWKGQLALSEGLSLDPTRLYLSPGTRWVYHWRLLEM